MRITKLEGAPEAVNPVSHDTFDEAAAKASLALANDVWAPCNIAFTYAGMTTKSVAPGSLTSSPEEIAAQVRALDARLLGFSTGAGHVNELGADGSIEMVVVHGRRIHRPRSTAHCSG